MNKSVPVPYFKHVTRIKDVPYYVAVSVYSNMLHIIITMNGKPGICAHYIPHSKLGDNPTMMYTIHPLLGNTSLQHELLMKQIASTPVIAKAAIPFVCNLMIQEDMEREDFLSLSRQIQDFIQEKESVITKAYHPYMFYFCLLE